MCGCNIAGGSGGGWGRGLEAVQALVARPWPQPRPPAGAFPDAAAQAALERRARPLRATAGRAARSGDSQARATTLVPGCAAVIRATGVGGDSERPEPGSGPRPGLSPDMRDRPTASRDGLTGQSTGPGRAGNVTHCRRSHDPGDRRTPPPGDPERAARDGPQPRVGTGRCARAVTRNPRVRRPSGAMLTADGRRHRRRRCPGVHPCSALSALRR